MTRIFHKRRHPVVEAIGQGLILLSVIVAFLYGGNWFPGSENVIISAAVKASAVGLLALFVLISTQSVNHVILFLALVASVIGDVFLALPEEGNFLKGLGSFLGAQFLFVILYLKNRMPLAEITALRIAIISLIWAAAGISLYFLVPTLGDMLVPVFVYSITLVMMATTAFLSQFPIKLAGLGALLFIVSDSVLGARMFMTMPDYTSYIVWATYYLAELFMTLGVMLLSERHTHFGGYRFD